MNDRELRYSVVGLGGKAHGVPRENQFVIIAASEIMAVLALASDLADLRARLGRIVVASTYDGDAGHGRRAAGRRRDGGDHEGGDQAEPGADARGSAGRWSTPGPSATSRTPTTRSSRIGSR